MAQISTYLFLPSFSLSLLPLSKGKHLYFGIVVVVVGRGRKTRGQSDTYPLKYLSTTNILLISFA